MGAVVEAKVSQVMTDLISRAQLILHLLWAPFNSRATR
jgi:hypothetical protein